MFTGIVEELGEVLAVDVADDSARLAVQGQVVTSDAGHGASIAVNGVCLTVVDVRDATFTADVMLETLERSTLGGLKPGDPVNLERAVRPSDRLGGHIVQGHVDGTAVVRATEPSGLTRFELPSRLSRYLVEKGSITVDGVSLTVVEAGDAEFSVALIPATKELTTLGFREPGDEVNIEVDVLAKHLERLAQPLLGGPDRGSGGVSEDNGGVGEAR